MMNIPARDEYLTGIRRIGAHPPLTQDSHCQKDSLLVRVLP